MADVKIQQWLEKYGARADFGYEEKADGCQVTASYYRASPARIRLYKFALKASAQQFCDLLRERYRHRPPNAHAKQPSF